MNQTDKEIQKAKHEKTKKKLKIIGPCLLGAGLIFVITGLVDVIISFTSNDMTMPKMFWCLFIGFPMTAIGLMLTLVGFNREVSRYMKNEQVPVANEMGEEISPAIKAVASAVKSTEEKSRCPYCGAETEKDSKFCPECGKQLKKTCSSCGETVDGDSKYCDNCGAKL